MEWIKEIRRFIKKERIVSFLFYFSFFIAVVQITIHILDLSLLYQYILSFVFGVLFGFLWSWGQEKRKEGMDDTIAIESDQNLKTVLISDNPKLAVYVIENLEGESKIEPFSSNISNVILNHYYVIDDLKVIVSQTNL